jgi:hypothetical protein
MWWEGKEREDIERELLAALYEARLAYEQARTRSIEAAACAADVSPGPDGVLACELRMRQNAVANRALDRYRQVLGWFTEFAITGKTPPGNKLS